MEGEQVRKGLKPKDETNEISLIKCIKVPTLQDKHAPTKTLMYLNSFTFRLRQAFLLQSELPKGSREAK